MFFIFSNLHSYKIGQTQNIYCRNGRVTRLSKQLRSHFYNAPLPTEIALLTALERLYLGTNYFAGTIPTGMLNLIIIIFYIK